MSGLEGAHLETEVAHARTGSELEGGSSSRRRRLRQLLLGLIALLFVFSIPWYRSTGDEVAIVLGLPDWVVVALGCYVAVAICNALAWLLAEVPEDDPAQIQPKGGRDGEGEKDGEGGKDS